MIPGVSLRAEHTAFFGVGKQNDQIVATRTASDNRTRQFQDDGHARPVVVRTESVHHAIVMRN